MEVHSVEETSNVAEAALERIVVRSEPIEQTLVAFTVQHVLSGRVFALHPCILLEAGPVHKILARLQCGLHGDTREQVIILGHQGALHL